MERRPTSGMVTRSDLLDAFGGMVRPAGVPFTDGISKEPTPLDTTLPMSRGDAPPMPIGPAGGRASARLRRWRSMARAREPPRSPRSPRARAHGARALIGASPLAGMLQSAFWNAKNGQVFVGGFPTELMASRPVRVLPANTVYGSGAKPKALALDTTRSGTDDNGGYFFAHWKDRTPNDESQFVYLQPNFPAEGVFSGAAGAAPGAQNGGMLLLCRPQGSSGTQYVLCEGSTEEFLGGTHCTTSNGCGGPSLGGCQGSCADKISGSDDCAVRCKGSHFGWSGWAAIAHDDTVMDAQWHYLHKFRREVMIWRPWSGSGALPFGAVHVGFTVKSDYMAKSGISVANPAAMVLATQASGSIVDATGNTTVGNQWKAADGTSRFWGFWYDKFVTGYTSPSGTEIKSSRDCDDAGHHANRVSEFQYLSGSTSGYGIAPNGTIVFAPLDTTIGRTCTPSTNTSCVLGGMQPRAICYFPIEQIVNLHSAGKVACSGTTAESYDAPSIDDYVLQPALDVGGRKRLSDPSIGGPTTTFISTDDFIVSTGDSSSDPTKNYTRSAMLFELVVDGSFGGKGCMVRMPTAEFCPDSILGAKPTACSLLASVLGNGPCWESSAAFKDLPSDKDASTWGLTEWCEANTDLPECACLATRVGASIDTSKLSTFKGGLLGDNSFQAYVEAIQKAIATNPLEKSLGQLLDGTSPPYCWWPACTKGDPAVLARPEGETCPTVTICVVNVDKSIFAGNTNIKQDCGGPAPPSGGGGGGVPGLPPTGGGDGGTGLDRKVAGLPLWSWIAIGLVVLLMVVVLLFTGNSAGARARGAGLRGKPRFPLRAGPPM